MTNKIEETFNYYNNQSKSILNYVNARSNLSVDEIIKKGEELAVLEFKMTALEIVK